MFQIDKNKDINMHEECFLLFN